MRQRIGILALYALAALTAILPLLATRLHPAPTPHARYHDACLASLALFLASASFHFTWNRATDRNLYLNLAFTLPSLPWWSALLAFAFPDTAGLESALPHRIPTFQGLPVNELPLALAMSTLLALARLLAHRRYL